MINLTPQKKDNVKNITLIFSVILISILFYLLNRHFLPYMDDWGYTFVSTGKRPQNIFEIFQSEYNQYMIWGGRSVVHVIARILLWIGEIWSDILNTS